MACPNVPQDIDATAIGHIDVEDDEVPLAVAQLLQRLLTAAGLGDRVDRAVLLQIMPEPGPHHRVIVRNQYAWHSASDWRGRHMRSSSIRKGHSIGPLKASPYAGPLIVCRRILTKSYGPASSWGSMPQQYGPAGSSRKRASPVTCAVPVMMGVISPWSRACQR